MKRRGVGGGYKRRYRSIERNNLESNQPYHNHRIIKCKSIVSAIVSTHKLFAEFCYRRVEAERGGEKGGGGWVERGNIRILKCI